MLDLFRETGWENKELAEYLHNSPRTIQTHLGKIMSKLGATNRADLMRVALLQQVEDVEDQMGGLLDQMMSEDT